MTFTLGHRPLQRFWGWGNADEGLSPQELTRLQALAPMLGIEAAPGPDPGLEEFALAPPRVTPPASLAPLMSAAPYDRLTHCCGKSFADLVRWQMRQPPAAPDWVAFPRDEQQLADVLDYAATVRAAVIPFGGGTSVCGGVESAIEGDYAAVISLDTQYLNQVLEIDPVSRAARIQGGALGPELEAALRPSGLTLRHFPQSFAFSTLGGWLATRAGGHFATAYTHIDDLTEGLRMLTPRGVLESRRLPGSGAGPSPDRWMLGSEGSLGVITEAWMRLQQRPLFRASASVRFPHMGSACRAVRGISQAGLFPSNCRLLDPLEASLNGVGDGSNALLVLGFESADHALGPWLDRALEIAAGNEGQWDAEAVQRSAPSGDGAAEPAQAQRSGATGEWRQQFLRAPYFRNYLTGAGVIADTFETAVTWRDFDDLYAGVKERVLQAIREACGCEGMLSCRFTHVYPDGPAPYFTLYAQGSKRANMAEMLARWQQIKLAANAAVVEFGGTVTHHHAVGRDHRFGGYDVQAPALFREAFAASRLVVDPAGMMNPGVLVDVPRRGATAGGVLQPKAAH